MADIKQVEGVYGGVDLGTNVGNYGAQADNGGFGINQSVGETGNGGVYQEFKTSSDNSGNNLPMKNNTFWAKFKSICFKEIKVELTPYQQKVENEINDFLHQEITWEKVHDFLFQEIRFGKKKNL